MAHDPKLLENVARGMADAYLGVGAWIRMPEAECNVWLGRATAALDAIEAMGCVVVPVEPTGKMLQAGHEAGSALSRCSLYERLAVSFRAMLEAHPGAA